MITLSEIRTTEGAFTYYIITEGGRVSKMLMQGYGGWGGVGLVMADANEVFYKSHMNNEIFTEL